LLKELQNKADRSARFKTVIALILNGNTYCFEGICEGEIALKPCGNHGFGYDPLFIPNGYDMTFAEMDLEEKNKISHRGRAFSKLLNFLKEL